MLSYYQILQVKETATEAEIKQAYRSLGKIVHPDLNNNTEEANTIFRLLHVAYETLSDPLKRKAYDASPNPNLSVEERLASYQKQNQKQGIKLKEYEQMVKDFKEKIYLKSERERELLREIAGLKQSVFEIEKSIDKTEKLEEKPNKLQEKPIYKEKKAMNLTKIILLIIAVNLGLFLSYAAISYSFWHFF